MKYYINQYTKYNINLCKAFINVKNLTRFQWLKLYIHCYTYAIIHYKKAKQYVLDSEYILEYYKNEKENKRNK
jgi:hypothetical protein